MRSNHPPVRGTDPITSWVAAQNLRNPKLLREVIHEALSKFGPMTHDQLIDVVSRVRSASPSGVRTRTAELVEDGLVEPVPDMIAKSRYGRASLLWRVKP